MSGILILWDFHIRSSLTSKIGVRVKIKIGTYENILVKPLN